MPEASAPKPAPKTAENSKVDEVDDPLFPIDRRNPDDPIVGDKHYNTFVVGRDRQLSFQNRHDEGLVAYHIGREIG